MGISINGPSGIDTAGIIDSLVAIEQQKVTDVETTRDAYQVKIDAYSQLRSLLTDIGTKASALKSATDFDLFNTISNDEDVVKLTGGQGAQEGSYDVSVYQLASHEKMISSNAVISDQHAALSSFGINTGTVAINGTELTINATDTLQDLRRKINDATDTDGSSLGVSASVIKLADNNFRLVLTATDPGSDGVTYEDISGSTLQDLGIITNAAGDKGNAAQVLTSGIDAGAAFAGLSVGDTVAYTGKDHAGNEINGTFTVGAGSTVDDLLDQMEEDFHGLVSATIDGAGSLVLTDLVEGRSQLGMISMTFGGTDAAMAVTTAGAKGAGVLTVGADAYFSVDGLNMVSSDNSADGFIAGVTLDLNGVSGNQSVHVGIERDVEGIEAKMTGLLDAYNALLSFKNTATAYGNPDDENSTDGDLAGDSTVGSILTKVRSIFQTSFEESGGAYSTMTMVGLKTNSKTGAYELDKELFHKALTENFDDTLRLFTTDGYASTNDVQMGRYQSSTKSGVYDLEEVDSAHLRIRKQGSTDWYDSDARTGDIVSFSDGPAAGLSLTAPTGSLGGVSQTFTFSKGIGTLLDELTKDLNSSSDGLVKMRQESFSRSMDSAKDRIDSLQDRVDRYRERLVKQFSAMEQSLSSLRSQSANMLAALGSTSS